MKRRSFVLLGTLVAVAAALIGLTQRADAVALTKLDPGDFPVSTHWVQFLNVSGFTPGPYTENGATFTVGVAETGSLFGSGAVGTPKIVGTDPPKGPLHVSFSTPVLQVGWDVIYPQVGIDGFELFSDAQGLNSLGVFTTTPYSSGDSNTMFTGFASDTPFQRITLTTTSSGTIFIDDFRYVVPEPVTGLATLFGAAALICPWRGRRKPNDAD